MYIYIMSINFKFKSHLDHRSNVRILLAENSRF